MRLKINFMSNPESGKTPVLGLDELVSFIHRCLGENNEWHDKHSCYSISQMHGGVYDEESKSIQYPNGGYCIVSVDEDTDEGDRFMKALLAGLSKDENRFLSSMVVESYIPYSVFPQDRYDIVRVETLHLRQNGKAITCKDEDYLQVLQEHTVRKLKRSGVSDRDAESIRIEPFHEEKWREKFVKWKKTVVTPSSNVMFILKGNKAARKKILAFGFGQSTGCGFGFAKTKSDCIE